MLVFLYKEAIKSPIDLQQNHDWEPNENEEQQINVIKVQQINLNQASVVKHLCSMRITLSIIKK